MTRPDRRAHEPMTGAPVNGPAAALVESGVEDLEIAPFSHKSNSPANSCPACGRELPPRTGPRGGKRERCDGCGRFHWFLRAVERELKAIKFASDAHRSAVRSRLVKIANTLPVPRDGRGRFRAGEQNNGGKR